MPYTPPAQQSPASSKPSTPLLLRNHTSFPLPHSHSNQRAAAGARPALPRSTSSIAYLQKHRRSPSWQQPATSTPHYDDSSRPSTADQAMHGHTMASLRQSPPPVTDNIMPAGAIMSPPESPLNSSDDEDQTRGRRREKSDPIEELTKAVHRSIEVRREPSPNATTDALHVLKLSIPEKASVNLAPHSARPALTESARKISHSRSNTESSIPDIRYTQSARTSLTNSDDSDMEDDDDLASKPPLLRKKSGELVKPALRASSRRRPSSMPGTPTYSKAVHFNDNIEQVRHFLQVDRPIAVSAGSSPAEMYDDENEFPFGSDDRESRPAQWDIQLPNFPRESLERQSSPVRVERIFLSSDKRTLIGTVAVANLSFHKLVVARFTLDHWKTTSEIVAEYNNDVRQRPREDGYDQFNFNIKLTDQANIEQKTLLLCVRYSVNGQDHWDNNANRNYAVEFTRKAQKKAENAAQQGLGARPLGAIPRSRHSGSASVGRPRSMPTFEDDFAGGFDGENGPGIRLKKPVAGFKSDMFKQRAPASQAFGHRYDFGASLSAALTHAQATLGDRSGLTKKVDSVTPTPAPPAGSTITPRSDPVMAPSGLDSPRPDALLADTRTLDSEAYQEFVSKFCFFGAKPVAPSGKPARPMSGDGASDGTPTEEVSRDGTGTSTPSLTRSVKTITVEHVERVEARTSPGSQSPSPVTGTLLGERPSSPAAFGFPFHQNVFAADSQTPTAIRG